MAIGVASLAKQLVSYSKLLTFSLTLTSAATTFRMVCAFVLTFIGFLMLV